MVVLVDTSPSPTVTLADKDGTVSQPTLTDKTDGT